MSTTSTAPTTAPTTIGAPGAAGAPGWWRRHRVTVLLVLAVLAVVVASALASIGRDGLGGALDPSNPKPDGARALARVLDQQGVEVQVVRSQSAYLRAPVDAGTTVVVTNGADLGPTTLARLRAHARSAGEVVLVAPSDPVLARLGLVDLDGGLLGGRYEPGCDDALVRGLVVDVPASTAGLPAPGCFGDDSGVLLRRSPVDSSVRLLAGGAVLSNTDVLDGDNAALALRLLGQHPRVLWYVADPGDTSAADAVSIGPLLPRWLVPGLWLLAVGVLALALLRGRRLGPLVREPLPVVVRATESTESRGRLYRRVRDRDHAARVLRAASRRRLAVALSLPRDVDLATLVVAVARAAGRAPDEVGPVLADAPVPDDTALADLGRGLLQIEAEARRG